MEISPQDPAFKENIAQVMRTLPPFIRTYIEQQKYTKVAVDLMSKYKLRIDQGGVLELNLLLLLMGINNPTEFTQALLTDAKLDQQMVNSLVKDINDQVFIPLRKEEEALNKNANAPQVQPKLDVPQTRPAAPVAAKPTPPPQKPAPAVAPHIAPLPPKTAMPAPASLGDIVRSITAPKPSDTKLLEDREEPHIEMQDNPKVVNAESPQPAVSTPIPSAPAPAPRPMPVAPEEPAIPSVAASVPPPTPPGLPQINKVPPPPPVTSYSNDPYREPVDEK